MIGGILSRLHFGGHMPKHEQNPHQSHNRHAVLKNLPMPDRDVTPKSAQDILKDMSGLNPIPIPSYGDAVKNKAVKIPLTKLNTPKLHIPKL